MTLAWDEKPAQTLALEMGESRRWAISTVATIDNF
jgi:hypothetical protein